MSLNVLFEASTLIGQFLNSGVRLSTDILYRAYNALDTLFSLFIIDFTLALKYTMQCHITLDPQSISQGSC